MKNLFQFNLSNKFSIIALITLLSFLIATGSYLFYKQQESSIRQEKYNELKAIADLKVSQIENWIHERSADAKNVVLSEFLTAAVQNWLKDRSNVKLKSAIIKRLSIVQSEKGYENIFLCTPDASVQLSAVDSKLTRLDPFIESKLTEAVEKRDIVFTDFYFSQLENKILYDVIAPVVTNENKVIAVVVFRIDPNLFLYPLIQTWPTPSKTAETAILRVEQDSVVFLNELRHGKNTALQLRIPMTQLTHPGVQAALGRTGAFEGIDYRGAEVLSDIRVIPATKWIMVAKVDKSEIYSDLYITAGVIAGIAFLLIIACGFGFVFIYNARQKDIFKELYKKEKELSRHQERFEVIMESLGEGIITTDLNGKIQYLNKRAEELTGWNLREAKGRMLSEIYRVKNEETGQIENNILQKVLKHGIVKELANHTILITKSGTEIPVMDTGAPVFDTNGSVNGIVITFQDETEKRTQQKLLRESEERLQEAQSLAKLGHWNLDMQTMTLSWSLETYRIHEVDPSVKPDLESAINFYAPEARPIITDAVNRGIKDGSPWDLELPFITAKGKRLWVRAQGKAEFKDGNCVRLFGTFQDITERKELELQLQKSNERFNMLVLQLNDVVWTASPDGSEIVDVSKSFESVYGVPIEQLKQIPNSGSRWCILMIEQSQKQPSKTYSRKGKQSIALLDPMALSCGS
jgi:PAS domain S-box-containing protein